MSLLGRRIEIRGIVQGVGFRPWVYRLANEEGIVGRVRNDAGGVTIEAFGHPGALEQFVRRLADDPPPAAELCDVRAHAIPDECLEGFTIHESDRQAERRISIPPDLAICPKCLREIFDPADRRHGYALTNCTDCGPRFTIARDAPYDRATTTMAAFTMCPRCQYEYDSVDDRRFQAQANACPTCGPALTLVTCDRTVHPHRDPITAAASALRLGNIVAIKGLGGFHLACDATAPDVVERLRVRKRRDAKPFAVMIADLHNAEELALLTEAEKRLLTSTERPIVLARARADTELASNVAPHSALVGVMLPYTPLHAMLMREMAKPLVMTSANLSDEPLAYRNDEALERLGGIADLFLMHDREIEAPCDDSVTRVITDRPVVLRRARGYVPRPISVASPFGVPVLACGALMKSTFCIGYHDEAYLGPHIGDLDNLDTYQTFEASIARMERFLRVTPAIVAHDLHPDYPSTAYALTCTACERIAVQHHHAHIASAMAEHALPGPVLGVAFDGTGYGTDGTAWGGEVMVARYERFDRIATLRGVALAGGDAAIRHPWRIALALLEDAFDGRPPLDALHVFHAIRPQDLVIVRQMIAAAFRSPIAHGVGRYFDGVGALVLGRPEARYDAEVATEWGGVADPQEHGCFGYEVDYTSEPWTVDLRPMVRDVVSNLLKGVSGSVISGRFHNTLVQATREVIHAAAREHGALPVVLTGGCFQNPHLAEGLAGALASHVPVYLHSRVPPGDGGIALGQAVVAAAIARSG